MLDRTLFYLTRFLIKLIGQRQVGEALAWEVAGPLGNVMVYVEDDGEDEDDGDDDDGGEPVTLDPQIWGRWSGQ